LWRQKNDAADAEAIAEAAARPTMRFVEPKSEAQQAAAMAYRTRDLGGRPPHRLPWSAESAPTGIFPEQAQARRAIWNGIDRAGPG
jgi:hypothetical protein